MSLFFVVAAMLEFAVTLLINRIRRKQNGEIGKRGSKIFPGNTSLTRSLSEIKMVLPPTVNLSLTSRKRLAIKESEYLDLNRQQNNAKFFTISHNFIDISATVLFPTSYTLFNIVYWYLVF